MTALAMAPANGDMTMEQYPQAMDYATATAYHMARLAWHKAHGHTSTDITPSPESRRLRRIASCKQRIAKLERELERPSMKPACVTQDAIRGVRREFDALLSKS